MRYLRASALALVAIAACAAIWAVPAFAAAPTGSNIDITSSRSAGGDVDGDGYTLPGDVLTATVDWSGNPTSTTYQWADCTPDGACTDILGATSASYTVQSSDYGYLLSYTATATNTDGTGTVGKTRYPEVGAPIITGVQGQDPAMSNGRSNYYVGVGDTITATNGDWYGSPTSYSYEWEDCDPNSGVCNPIAGAADQPTYTVQSSDLNSQVDVLVTGTNDYGSSQWGSNVSFNTVGAPVQDSSSGYPALSNSGGDDEHADAGDTLTVSNGPWLGAGTLTYSYQWQDCDENYNCTPISGAPDSSSYTVQPSDDGSLVAVQITASNGYGSPGTADAYLDNPVGVPFQADGDYPSLASNNDIDAVVVGDLLTVDPGTWQGNPTSFSYQWQDCTVNPYNCTDIPGATSATYTVQSSDVGAYLTANVTANKTGVGSSEPSQSGWSSLVSATAGSSSAGGGSQEGSSSTSTPAAPTTTTSGDTVTSVVPVGLASSVSVPAPAGDTTPPAAISWAADTFSTPVTVSATVQPSSSMGGQTTTGGFSAGTVEVDLVIKDASGNEVHHFPAPLDVTFANPGPNFQPAYSEDGITWIAIPKLAGTTLPAGQQDGYYVAADGTVHVLTMHATDFGVLTGLTLWGGTKTAVKHTVKSLVVHLATGRTSQATVKLENRHGKVLRTVKASLNRWGTAVKVALPKNTKPGIYLVKVQATSTPVSATKTFVIRIK